MTACIHNGIEFFHASVEDRRVINKYVEAFHKLSRGSRKKKGSPELS